jgi:hypothetical protein
MQSAPTLIHEMRPKILERRARLQAAARSVSAEYVNDLLAEVDATLRRIEDGTASAKAVMTPLRPTGWSAIRSSGFVWIT